MHHYSSPVVFLKLVILLIREVLRSLSAHFLVQLLFSDSQGWKLSLVGEYLGSMCEARGLLPFQHYKKAKQSKNTYFLLFLSFFLLILRVPPRTLHGNPVVYCWGIPLCS